VKQAFYTPRFILAILKPGVADMIQLPLPLKEFGRSPYDPSQQEDAGEAVDDGCYHLRATPLYSNVSLPGQHYTIPIGPPPEII
jgi:hypothetical protein